MTLPSLLGLPCENGVDGRGSAVNLIELLCERSRFGAAQRLFLPDPSFGVEEVKIDVGPQLSRFAMNPEEFFLQGVTFFLRRELGAVEILALHHYVERVSFFVYLVIGKLDLLDPLVHTEQSQECFHTFGVVGMLRARTVLVR